MRSNATEIIKLREEYWDTLYIGKIEAGLSYEGDSVSIS